MGVPAMAMLAIALFVGLFAFGKEMFHWSDPDGYVQLSLLAAFLFGVIASFRRG